MAVAAVRLIALTGLRREEACALRWGEIDDAGCCLRLEATKTGRSHAANRQGGARCFCNHCRVCRRNGCSRIAAQAGAPS